MLIIVIGLVLYFPTLFNSFVWDDEELIVNNVQVHSLENLPAFFSGSTFNSGGGGNLAGLYYKPLMTTAFSAVYSLVGPNPFFFHAFQVGVHLANSVLVYLIFFYLFKEIALPVSLLFLVHPINAEAVVYVADYQDVLFFFFGALSFWLILNKKKSYWVGLTILLSLLSKETGAVFAVIIFTYLLMFDRAKIKSYVLVSLGAFAVYAFLRFGVAGIFFNKHGLTEITTMNLVERLINIPEIVFTYLKNFFWPVDLAINQQWVVRKISVWPLIVDLLFFVLLIWRRSQEYLRLWLFFFVWFLLGLGFHLQIFPLDLTVSDRWFYLPVVGLLGMLVLSFKPKPVVISILVLILAARTFVREFDWRNGLTLYSHDIKISQNAFDLENNLGVELFRAGDFTAAKTHFERSVALSPRWWTNWNNLGAVVEREGDLALAQAYYRRAIDNGQYYLAYENYAKILYRQDKITELRKFLESEALIRLPYNQTLRQVYSLIIIKGD